MKKVFLISFTVFFLIALGTGCKCSSETQLPPDHPPLEAVTGVAPIKGTIDLAPNLKAKLPRKFFLFIIAEGQSGPPVGVERIAQPTFPYSFTLNPMGHTEKVSWVEGHLTVTARIDQDGNVGEQPGDLSGYTKKPVKPGDAGIDITIDSLSK